MRLRKIASALFACLAIGAFAANTAQAAGSWTIGTTENQTTAGTELGEATEELTVKNHGTSVLEFTSTVLGEPVQIISTGVHVRVVAKHRILEWLFGPKIEVQMEDTGIHVIRPSTKCSVPGGAITTNPLIGEVIMDPTAGSTAVFYKFSPETAGGAIATVEFEGAECPLGGASAPIKGTFCGESVHTNAGGTGFEPNKTGTLTKVQTALFGATQQTTGGCALTLGTKAAQYSGALDFELSGTNAGKPFGAD